eukprot:Rmarinus@m.19985
MMEALVGCLFCLFFCEAHALTVGGSGYAVKFSRERADVISLALGEFAGDEISVMYWMKIFDEHQDIHYAVNYGAYDSRHVPSISSPDEIGLRHYRDYLEIHRGHEAYLCDHGRCAMDSVEWVHVTYTWRSQDGLASVYLDGDLVASHTLSAGEPIIPNGVFVLGQEPHGFVSLYDEEHAFTGVLDEVVVLTRELSAQEAKDYADRGRPLDDDDLLLYWTFDDPTRTEFVSDLSPQGRDGYIGFLDNRLDELSYATGRDPQPPTSPAFVVSTAPLAGHGPAVTALHAGESAVEVALLFALDEAKIPVDRRDPNGSASVSDGESMPTLRDYWASYPNASVTVKIESLPQYGSLRDLELQSLLSAGDVVSSGARVLYEMDIGLYESTWAPLQEAAGSILAVPDVFTYSVDGIVATAHVVASQTVQTPPEKEYRILEDEHTVMILGGLGMLGDEMKCVIQTIPTHGRLYQAAFDGAPSYETLITDEMRLTEITTAGTAVSDHVGVVLYFPAADESSTDQFDNFTYTWKNDLGIESVQAANVTIFVDPVNDGPTVSPVTLTIAGDEDTVAVVQLESNDIDETFSHGAILYKVLDYPRVGSLYNFIGADEGSNHGTEEEDNPLLLGAPLDHEVVHTLNMYARRVVNASSQDTKCNEGCYYPWMCECPDGDTAHHWTNALGLPDVYPMYGDNEHAGAFAESDAEFTPGVGSFVEFALEYSVYLTQLTVFETYNPGGIVGLSVSNSYSGPDTEWRSIWEGVEDLSVLSSEDAREWEIPHCPYLHPMSYMRLDMNLSLRRGQEQIDAIRVEGVEDVPPGYVEDDFGRVAYIPRPGVFSNDHAVYDSFTYTATDCVDFSPEPAVVSIIVEPPTDHAVFLSEDFPIDSGLPTIVTVDLDAVAEDARTFGVTEEEVVGMSARLLSYAEGEFADVTVYQVSDANGGIGESFALGERLNSSSGIVEYVVGSLTGSEAHFAILAGPSQGHVDLALWVALGSYVYAIGVYARVTCAPGFWNRASDGACVACRLLEAEDAEDEAGWHQACDLELCEAGTQTVWLSGAEFECIPCEAGFYAPEAGMKECLPCESGTYSSAGMPVCFTCSPGYYSGAAAEECSKCPAGSYSDTEAATECQLCPLGYYINKEGQDHCNLCPPAYYADHEGAEECTACPPHTNNVNSVVYDTYEVVTHATIDECFPEKGWYGPPGETPSRCPKGGSCCYCREEGEALLRLLESDPEEPCTCLGGTPMPYPQPHYVRSVYESNVMIECPSDAACLGGDNVTSPGVCADLHEGYRCGACSDDSYMMGHHCEECTAGGAVAYLLVVILPVLVVGLIYVSTLGVRLSSLHVMTDTLQILALMYYLPIRWDAIMEDFFLVCALANFNPQIFQTECLINIPYFGRSGFLLCFPLMFLGVWGLSYLIVRYVTPHCFALNTDERVSNFQYCLRSPDVEFKNGVFVGGAVLALMLMHPLLFSKSIEPFICDEEADGYYYMSAAPEYRCYEDQEWQDNLGMFVVGLVVWGLGIPVFVMVLLYRIRHRLFDYDVRVRFGLIYKGYKPSCFWWDIMAFSRASFLMIFVAAFAHFPAMQILLSAILLTGHSLAVIYVFPDRSATLNCFSVLGESVVLLVFLTGVVFDHAVESGSMSDDSRHHTSLGFVCFIAAVLFVLCGVIVWESGWTSKKVSKAGNRATTKECEMIFRDAFKVVKTGEKFARRQQKILETQGFEVDLQLRNHRGNRRVLRDQIVKSVQLSVETDARHLTKKRSGDRVAEAQSWSQLNRALSDQINACEMSSDLPIVGGPSLSTNTTMSLPMTRGSSSNIHVDERPMGSPTRLLGAEENPSEMQYAALSAPETQYAALKAAAEELRINVESSGGGGVGREGIHVSPSHSARDGLSSRENMECVPVVTFV